MIAPDCDPCVLVELRRAPTLMPSVRALPPVQLSASAPPFSWALLLSQALLFSHAVLFPEALLSRPRCVRLYLGLALADRGRQLRHARTRPTMARDHCESNQNGPSETLKTALI